MTTIRPSRIVGQRWGTIRARDLPPEHDLWLVREPTNSHDPNACIVAASWWCEPPEADQGTTEGHTQVEKLGYIPATDAAAIAPILDSLGLATVSNPLRIEWAITQNEVYVNIPLPE